MIIEWFFTAIGIIALIIFTTGMSLVMLCAAHNLWKNYGFIEKFFAMLFGALGALLMAPLILSICIIIYQCVNAIV